MIQWEYNKQQWIYQSDREEIEMLDSFGRLGWENYYKNGNIYYFKRPLSTADKIFNDVKNEVEGDKKMPWKPSDTKGFLD